MQKNEGVKPIAQNKKARHEYFIEETVESGLSLCGTEVKSIRAGKVNLKDSYVAVAKGEAYLHNMHVSPYEQGNIFNRDPLRVRKLLLHKREIMRMGGLVQQQGYTLVPLRLYLKNGRVKMELALAKGKKLYDKRASAAERDAEREMQRSFRRDERGDG